jgi:hypothetical protein
VIYVRFIGNTIVAIDKGQMIIDTMLLGDTDDKHLIGNIECDACWPDYPKKCRCGGFIHASFGDEDADCNYWLYEKCDNCGDDFEEAK